MKLETLFGEKNVEPCREDSVRNVIGPLTEYPGNTR